jgi:3-deoxy-manno-octulosonate cytidylyltransferase (CMP-KDO synthetase)
MSAVGIIPARYAASRFPGKPLAKIAGVSMIERVWRGACEAKTLRQVFVATDDARIASCCRSFGAPVVMTSPTHTSGSDRIAEAASTLSDDIIVNIQGDEPLLKGFVIDAAVEALLENEEDLIATLVHRNRGPDALNPSRVKVVVDRHGHALYFSRSPIPYAAPNTSNTTFLQHIGIYAFRRDFLLQYAALPQTPGELRESLEQLRVLEHGIAIRVAEIEGWNSVAVDHPEDVATVEALLASINPAAENQ